MVYTFAICFLGNDDFYGSFTVSKITVQTQKPNLEVNNFKFKSSTKSKVIKATLKSSRNNPIQGKTISFTVNNKVYTAKTDSKGIASVNVSLSSKKTYAFTVKYAGDDTYSSVSKSANILVY